MILTTKKIAKLARIKISDEEAMELSKDLTKILNWVEQLQKVDVDHIDCVVHPTGQTMLLRDDVVAPTNTVEEVLSNAPETQFDMFVVPKVVE